MVTANPIEQRNPYKGTPRRAFVRVRFKAVDGSENELELLADTGSPYAVILSESKLLHLKRADGPDVNTNFGFLAGGWIRISMPEFGLVKDVIGYGSDVIVTAAQASHSDFEGLAGLPLLASLEYGGDGKTFWIRASLPNP